MKPRYKKNRSKNTLRTKVVEKESAERIQKVLARAGLGSRRQIEEWIGQGKLRVNGKVAQLGDRLRLSDRVALNGRPVDFAKRINVSTRVLIYYKPTGEVVTRRDPEGRAVIFTQLPKLKLGRWIAVGRLDINTQGLLLVTNNGELANRLMHPSHSVEREYMVRILGRPSDSVIQQLKQGVQLEDGLASFGQLSEGRGEGANRWFRVTVQQGRNRIVRRLWESQGFKVNRLIRVRYGDVVLPERLRPRVFYELSDIERATLLESVDMKEIVSSR